jgi:divalent metal cation (Fe/Co/Zn/Cd) transporter
VSDQQDVSKPRGRGRYITWVAIDMLRSGLPDLLDRSVGEAAQLAIVRVLSGRFDSYASFHGLRTCSASGRLFVEVSLGYPASLSFAEVDRRRTAVKDGIRDALGDCDVTVKVRGEAPRIVGNDGAGTNQKDGGSEGSCNKV